MFERLLAPLLETLRPHFGLSKTRLETLAVLLVGLANCRTVNLSHLASQFPSDAKHGSNYRRLQRFFQFVHLPYLLDADLCCIPRQYQSLGCILAQVPGRNVARVSKVTPAFSAVS